METKELLNRYGLTEKQITKILSLNKTIKYTCVRDYQTTDFQVGETKSVFEWVVWAIEDRWNCCEEELKDFTEELLSQKSQKAMIGYIGAYWGIEIVKGAITI